MLADGATRCKTDNPYEAEIGYSRAIRVGDFIAVSGTTAIQPDGTVVGADVGEQARRIFQIIEEALVALGSSLADVIRVRHYLVDMLDFALVAQVHREMLGRVAPAATALQVTRFLPDGVLIEIEVDAIVRAR